MKENAFYILFIIFAFYMQFKSCDKKDIDDIKNEIKNIKKKM